MKIHAIQNAAPSFSAKIVKNQEMEGTIEYLKNNGNSQEINDFINDIKIIKQTHNFDNFELRKEDNYISVYLNNSFLMSKLNNSGKEDPSQTCLKIIKEFVKTPFILDQKKYSNQINHKNVHELEQLQSLDEIRNNIEKLAVRKLLNKLNKLNPYDGTCGYRPNSNDMRPYRAQSDECYYI